MDLLPANRDLASHAISVTTTNRRVVVSFDYPDCTRTYDGERWSVTEKPRTTLYNSVTGEPIFDKPRRKR